MKIALGNLNPKFNMDITGTEDWLVNLYKDFAGCEKPKILLTGNFELELEMAGTVKASGVIKFNAHIDCGRCTKKIDWPQDLSFNTRFYESLTPEELPNDHELTQGELDNYYIEDGQIDILTLIVDTINADIPNHPVLLSEDGDHCSVCLDKVGSENYEDPGGDEMSPFAALKNLKTRH
jgi:uncharacterized metal-binding protein YceD (DUF177 family)